MTERSDPNDTTKCPLCGQPNECAIAAGKEPESCWCMGATIDPKLIASIPTAPQGKACICSRCANQSLGRD